MDSINRMAIELVDEALDFAAELGIEGHELDSGATVIDFGVDADGGVEAGMLLTEIQTAGLATVQTRMGEVAGTPRPHVEISTDRPALALLCSQKAGWELVFDDFDGLGSGPARALVGEEAEFHELGYYDEFDLTVLAVESIDLPTDEVAEHVAEMTDLEPSAIFLPTYATGSLAGSVTGAARTAELAMFNLFELGYDPTNVVSISGTAPLAPVSYDESVAMGRTNDSVAYGGQVHMTVREDFDHFDGVVSSAGSEYSVPFVDLFEDAEWDFSEVDPNVFGPAQATIDVIDGPAYTLGETDEEILADSFDL
ncbi:methenyltetrahydromethanopterin cyclohydrolase [Haloferax namakaokahaiae]|uniref:Methenyltetrahydromethanopterin cyclohydrolase n=1 Tax=Haloferax namakaokahaiae TaxID=1748331 RepID=A0ABD5ZAP7_9EURY